MFRLVIFSLAAVVALAVQSSDTFGQKPAVKTDFIDAKATHYALLAQYKEMVGVIQSASPSGIEIRVQYSHQVTLPPDSKDKKDGKKDRKDKKDDNDRERLQKQLQHLQRELAEAKRSKKDSKKEKQREAQIANQIRQVQYRIQADVIQDQQQELLRAIRDKQARTKLDVDYVDFELPLLKNAIVRRLQATIEYDERGEPKEPPPTEKGLPGYPAKVGDLTQGDAVRIYLVPPTAAAAAAIKEATGRKVPTDRPFVSSVVIINDAPERTGKKK